MPRLNDAERNRRDLTEREFQKAYVKALRSLEFFVGHHYDSRFSDPGTKGMPDLLVVGHGVVFMVELKREKGRLSEEQRQWIAELTAAGVIVHVCRPSDWESMMAYAEAMAQREVEPSLRRMPIHKAKKKKRRQPL